MQEANEKPLTPLSVGQMGGDVLGSGRSMTLLDNTSHEDSFVTHDPYLFSFSVRSASCILIEIDTLKVVRDQMNGDFLGHNVPEIGNIEVESSLKTLVIMVVDSKRVHGSLAESPVSMVVRRHVKSTLCLFVVGTVMGKKSGDH